MLKLWYIIYFLFSIISYFVLSIRYNIYSILLSIMSGFLFATIYCFFFICTLILYYYLLII